MAASTLGVEAAFVLGALGRQVALLATNKTGGVGTAAWDVCSVEEKGTSVWVDTDPPTHLHSPPPPRTVHPWLGTMGQPMLYRAAIEANALPIARPRTPLGGPRARSPCLFRAVLQHVPRLAAPKAVHLGGLALVRPRPVGVLVVVAAPLALLGPQELGPTFLVRHFGLGLFVGVALLLLLLLLSAITTSASSGARGGRLLLEAALLGQPLSLVLVGDGRGLLWCWGGWVGG